MPHKAGLLYTSNDLGDESVRERLTSYIMPDHREMRPRALPFTSCPLWWSWESAAYWLDRGSRPGRWFRLSLKGIQVTFMVLCRGSETIV